MRKIIAFAAAGMLALAASVGAADARSGQPINERGTMVADASLFKHHWDVSERFNLQCDVKKGDRVRAVNRIAWIGGNKLVHLRVTNKGCDGWTYARNFKKN